MNTPRNVLHIRCFAIILTIVLGGPWAAQADSMTGQQWLMKLNSPTSSQDHLEAMIQVGNILFAWEGKSHCKPPQATVGQAVAITQKFLNENPQLWHEEVPHLIGAALGITWPCQRQDKGK